MKKIKTNKGFTLVELLISISIFLVLVFISSNFQRDVFFLNNNLQSSLNAQLDARHLVKVIVAEVRKSSPSANGTYPIEVASTSEMVFYSDTDGNGVVERVRYFLSGSKLNRGIILPSGSPVVYNPATESVVTLMNSVVSSSTLPIFQYYSSSYDGNSPALSFPVDIPSVRLVKINVIMDSNPNRSPAQIVVTSSVSIRNLKDNL